MSMRRPAGFISAFYDPLKNPDAPTIGTATGGDTSASVAFTAPSNVGGSAISGYGAISNPGNFTGTAASSPVTVSGLTNGTSYTFQVWAINTYGPSAYSASSGSVSPSASRGLFGGGNINGYSNVINYITISTTGNATDFGDLSQEFWGTGSCASTVRGLFASSAVATYNVIDYVTIATTGNSTDFGDLPSNQLYIAGCNSSTRGLFGGGYNGTAVINIINYVTIASTGNASDFGDVTVSRNALASCSSSTRGLFGGGSTGSTSNVIDYVTIASTGNASDFGDLTVARLWINSCSNSTRGLFDGGATNGADPAGSQTNVIDYVTIATTGNATDFGDLINGYLACAACSSSVRGVFAGGGWFGTGSTKIKYVTISTTGDATSFGDLPAGYPPAGTFGATGCSNGNGGVQ